MSKRKTKCNKLWELEFNWIQACLSDQYSAKCKLCQKKFLVSGSGIGQVRSHAISKLHVSRSKERKGQSQFNKDEDNEINLKTLRKVFKKPKSFRF